MERETKQIKAGEHTIVLKTYLNVKEDRAIRNVMMKYVKVDMNESIPKIDAFPAEVVDEIENQQVSQVVVSVDGKAENVLDALLELRAEEFKIVLDEVKQITNLEEKKTK